MDVHLMFTRAGYARHQRKLEEARQRVQAAGREVGQEAGLACDWHDNFGFEEARRRLEGESEQARRLADELSRARVVEVVDQDEVVAIGTTVVLDVDGREFIYYVGGYGETDLPAGVVSYDAPLIRPLLGARVDDERLATLAGKQCLISVLEIRSPGTNESQRTPGGVHE